MKYGLAVEASVSLLQREHACGQGPFQNLEPILYGVVWLRTAICEEWQAPCGSSEVQNNMCTMTGL